MRITWYHWMLSLIVMIYNCCQIPQYPSSVGVLTNCGKKKKKNQCLSVRILQNTVRQLLNFFGTAQLKKFQWQIFAAFLIRFSSTCRHDSTARLCKHDLDATSSICLHLLRNYLCHWPAGGSPEIFQTWSVCLTAWDLSPPLLYELL